MKLTAELSLYPFKDDYKPIIKSFIAAVREHGDLEIISNAMSTQICGDFDHVFAVVRQELKASYREHGRQVLWSSLFPGT